MARWYFLACFILTDSLVAGQSTRYELSGQKVSLKPDIPGTPESILWKRNGNKVVEFNGQEQEAYGHYINRVSVDWHTAELEITDLRIEDSGEYELEVYMNKKISTSFHELEVIDRVAKPTISCEMNDGGGSNKSGTLLCSVEPRQPRPLVTFERRSNGNVQSGTKLTIPLGDKYDKEVYSCRVSNPLSNETATFTAKDCYPGDDSVLIGVLGAIAVLSLLIVGLAIICCKQHNKACFAKGNRHDPEKRGATKGSDENTGDERRGLIDRTPTMPSTQRLIQEHDGDLQDETPKKGSVRNKIKLFESGFRGKTPPITVPADSKRNKDKNKRPPLDLNHLANNNRGDADEDQLRESAETKVPPCENTPEPAVELTNMISSTAAEQSGQLSEPAETEVPHHDASDSEKENEPKPADVSTNMMSDRESSTASEHQGQLSEPAETEVPHHDSSDSEKENEPKPADVSTNMMSDRESSTASEHQDLEKNKDEETGSPASIPRSESQSPLDPSNPARNDKGDADADQLSEPAEEVLPHRDSSDSEEENEPKPADVSTNTMSDLEPSTASEHQEKGEEGKSPVPKPRSQFAGGQKEDADSDQVNEVTDTSGIGETNESGASSEGKQFPPVSEQKDSEMTRHDQDPNLSQSETHTSEDNQQDMDKPVPAAEKESGSEGSSEEPDLYSASSHQPQSSTPTKPDNRSNDAFKESPDAAHDEPGQGGEGKTTRESDDSGESEDDTGEDKK